MENRNGGSRSYPCDSCLPVERRADDAVPTFSLGSLVGSRPIRTGRKPSSINGQRKKEKSQPRMISFANHSGPP